MARNFDAVSQGAYDNQLIFKTRKIHLILSNKGTVLCVPYKILQKFVYYYVSDENGYTIDGQDPQKGYEPDYIQIYATS